MPINPAIQENNNSKITIIKFCFAYGLSLSKKHRSNSLIWPYRGTLQSKPC